MFTSKDHLTVLLCRSIVLLVCMSLATGCTTFKPMAAANTEVIPSRIKPGDEVRLTTRDGRVREFIIKEVTDKQLVGENESVVDLSDITDIERREFSTGKTVGLVGGIIGVVLLIVIIAASNSKGSSGGSWNL